MSAYAHALEAAKRDLSIEKQRYENIKARITKLEADLLECTRKESISSSEVSRLSTLVDSLDVAARSSDS